MITAERQFPFHLDMATRRSGEWPGGSRGKLVTARRPKGEGVVSSCTRPTGELVALWEIWERRTKGTVAV
jgi:hypothetical protein